MSGYDYGEFLRRVQAHRRTSPTGCWVCDVLLPAIDGWWAGSAHALGEARRMCEKRSGGIVDAHHLVSKQALKREARPGFDGRGFDRTRRVGGWMTLDAVLMEPRNGVIVRRLHHDQLESRHLAIPVALLPADALAFANEIRMRWWLENQEARRVGPA